MKIWTAATILGRRKNRPIFSRKVCGFTMSDVRPRLLIVDDERSNINVLYELLKDTYRISVALNGQQAIERTEADKTLALILLDVQMPVMDGYEVCRRLKLSAGTAAIPIIFLTARDQVGDQARGFSLGAADYILKPVDPDILKARVATHITLSQAKAEVERQRDQLSRHPPIPMSLIFLKSSSRNCWQKKRIKFLWRAAAIKNLVERTR